MAVSEGFGGLSQKIPAHVSRIAEIAAAWIGEGLSVSSTLLAVVTSDAGIFVRNWHIRGGLAPPAGQAWNGSLEPESRAMTSYTMGFEASNEIRGGARNRGHSRRVHMRTQIIFDKHTAAA